MLHVLTGDGKGKTSAAMGMALRMLGHGGAVLAAQFLKDGSSGELEPLRRLGAEVLACGTPRGFYPLMDEAEQRRERERAVG